MQNPYQTLGVDRNATPDEIKKAYRRLASQHHPDKGGDTGRFQEIQKAYDQLTNPDGYNPQQPGNNPFGHNPFGQANFNFESIFDVFGARFQQAQQPQPQHARMTLWVQLLDIATSTKKTISVGTQQGNMTIEIDIPAGIEDGNTVQYAKIGPQGMDLLITFRIHPNPKFERQGPNLVMEQAVSVWDLILGAEIVIKDLQNNSLSLSVPPRTQPGTNFRLRGRGLAQRNGQSGDLLVRVQCSIPDHIPEPLLNAIAANRQN